MKVTRRKFLIGLGASCGGILITATGIRLFRGAVPSTVEVALELHAHPGWHEAGARYLTAFPGESRPRELLAGVFGGKPPELSSKKEIRAFLRARVREDFKKGSVVRLDGWVLSLTEARLAALSVLTTRKP